MEAPVIRIDRRDAPRHRRAEEHRVLTLRIRPGHHARTIDVSASGVLVETQCRLLPGRAVELQMETERQHLSVRGRVVRCAVVRLRPAVCYRGAIVFEQRLPWLDANEEYGIPMSDRATRARGREDATHDII
jgi:PilZ domain-containing protein